MYDSASDHGVSRPMQSNTLFIKAKNSNISSAYGTKRLWPNLLKFKCPKSDFFP